MGVINPPASTLFVNAFDAGVRTDVGAAAVLRALLPTLPDWTTLYFPPKTYQFNLRIELRSRLRILAPGATFLALPGVTAALLVGLGATAVSDLFIDDGLTLDVNGQAGINAFQITNGARVDVGETAALNCNKGFLFNTSTDRITLRRPKVRSAASTGIEAYGFRTDVERADIDTTADTGILLSGCPGSYVERPYIRNAGATGPTKHCVAVIAGSHRTKVTDGDLAGAGGMGILGDASTDLDLSHNVIDQAASTLECIGVTSTCARSTIASNDALNGKDNGISVSAPECGVTNNEVVAAQFMGIQFNATAVNSSATGNRCKNNGLAAGANPWAGIDLNGVTDVPVTGNRCWDDQGVKTQKYGVNERAAADHNVIVGNTLRGNATAAVQTIGANTINASNGTL